MSSNHIDPTVLDADALWATITHKIVHHAYYELDRMASLKNDCYNFLFSATT